MMRLLSVTNPGKKKRKKKHAKRRSKKAVKKVMRPHKKHKHAKRKHKKVQKAVIHMKKKRSHKRKSHKKAKVAKVSRRRRSRKNPSIFKAKGLTLGKVSVMDVGGKALLVGSGIAGQMLIQKLLLPMIPGYSTMGKWGKIGIDAAAAVVTTVALAAALPVVKVKNATEVSLMVGAGMLGSVALTAAMENEGVKTALLPSVTPTGVGALVVGASDKAKPYGLAAGNFAPSFSPVNQQIM